MKKISTSDTAIIEDELHVLLSDKRKSLAEIFKVKNSVGEICEIPVLENILTKNISKFSSAFLVKVLGACFRRNNDNYKVALFITEEFIKRKDKRVQYAAIGIFIMALSNYKPGNQFSPGLVYHLLLEKYFPRFESNALVLLLSWWQKETAVVLDKRLKNGLEALIAYAFARTSTSKVFKILLKILKAQLVKSKKRKDLLQLAEQNINPKLINRFNTWKCNNLERISRTIWLNEIKDALLSQQTVRVEISVSQIHVFSAKEWRTIGDAIRLCSTNDQLKWHTRIKILYLLITHQDKMSYAHLLINLANEDTERLQKQLNEKYLKEELVLILRTSLNISAINTMVCAVEKINESDLSTKTETMRVFTSNALNQMRLWAETLDGINLNASLGLEIKAMIRYAVAVLNFECLLYALKILETYAGIVDLTERRTYFKTFTNELHATLLPKTTNQKTKVFKLLEQNMHKIKLEPCVEKELVLMFKKHRVGIYSAI